MLIELTVTGADLPALEVAQAGLASFDGVEGVEYPVRIVSISRMANAEQGVVTYGVDARILAGPEMAEVASELAVLADRDGSLDDFLGGAPGAFRRPCPASTRTAHPDPAMGVTVVEAGSEGEVSVGAGRVALWPGSSCPKARRSGRDRGGDQRRSPGDHIFSLATRADYA